MKIEFAGGDAETLDCNLPEMLAWVWEDPTQRAIEVSMWIEVSLPQERIKNMFVGVPMGGIERVRTREQVEMVVNRWREANTHLNNVAHLGLQSVDVEEADHAEGEA